MKLTNPTDDQLNAAFAEHVAQLGAATRAWLNDHDDLNFTRSFGAVLPWLEKWRTVVIDWDRIAGLWSVGVGQYKDAPYYDTELPRAATIALLAAHGVEVEFTT